MTCPSDPLRGFFQDTPPDHIAVAVSGGSDSLALLSLLNDWRTDGGPDVSAVTVNHGLRPEAADEAKDVAHLCASWGVPHETLLWNRSETTGNMHDQARRARYALMAAWAADKKIPVISVAHTQDDLAETFLMRLARGAGLDGLSAMRPTWQQNGVTFARPLLSCSRDGLRNYLRAKKLTWVEDAANSDPSYDRSRVRAALPALGISVETLADAANHLAQSRDALHAATIEAAKSIAHVELGDVVLDKDGFNALHPELARRLILMCMHWITGADYPPRGAALTALHKDIEKGRNATLQGCDVSHCKGAIRITREAAAVANLRTKTDEVWDERWRLNGPHQPDFHIASLGEGGLRHCPDRAQSVLPARSLIAAPAVWLGTELIAAPLANLSNGWTVTLVPRTCDDFAAKIAH